MCTTSEITAKDCLPYTVLLLLADSHATIKVDGEQYTSNAPFYALSALAHVQRMSTIAKELFENFVVDSTSYRSLQKQKKDVVQQITISEETVHKGNSKPKKKQKNYYYLNTEESLKFIGQIVNNGSKDPYFSGESIRYFMYYPIYGRSGVINLKDRCRVMQVSKHLEYYQQLIGLLYSLYKIPTPAGSWQRICSIPRSDHLNKEQMEDSARDQINADIDLGKLQITPMLKSVTEHLGSFKNLISTYEEKVGTDNTNLTNENKTTQKHLLALCHKTLLVAYRALIQMESEPYLDDAKRTLTQLNDSLIHDHETFKKNHIDLCARIKVLQAIYEQYRNLKGAPEVVATESKTLKLDIDSQKRAIEGHLEKEKETKKQDDAWQQKYDKTLQIHQQLMDKVEKIEKDNQESEAKNQRGSSGDSPGYAIIHDATSSSTVAAAAAMPSDPSSH